MKKLFLVLPLLFLFLGCGSKKKVTLYIPPANSKTHGGVWESRYVEIGIASWYGPGFHGKKTASGEIYNMYAMTAAHRTLPLGTYVRVTNLENGRSVVVRINDRGPFVAGRVIDLSYSAAKRLGFAEKGTALVKIVPIGRVNLGKGKFYIQLGAFKNRKNAIEFKNKISGKVDTLLTIVRVKNYYRVLAGPLTTLKDARKLKNSLSKKGFEGTFIIRL